MSEECEVADWYSIVYMSMATVGFEQADLLRLLRKARCHNSRHGLTGFLMYGNGHFLQVIEGRTVAVRQLFARILADPRHGRLETLADGPIARPEFAGWHMAFAPPPPSAGTAGYLTPPQLVLAGLGCTVQQVMSEFLEISSGPARL